MVDQGQCSHPPEWFDWRWQLKNRVVAGNLQAQFPGLDAEALAQARSYDEDFQFALTPYVAALIERDVDGSPLPTDPIWLQHRFYESDPVASAADYDRETLNWEVEDELPTHFLHHKYPDKAALRIVDTCLTYCNYCYLAKRVLDRHSTTHSPRGSEAWSATLQYLRQNQKITDVLISGGEPLLMPTARLRKVFQDLRSIPSIRTLRLNTRAFSHLPFRVDDEVASLFKEFRLTALEVHVVHPREITADFDAALDRLDRSGNRPLVLWRAPLLRGINDTAETLEHLLRKLYERRIVPYRLFHYAPFSPARSLMATRVRAGVELLLHLRRRIPGIAFPAYTLFHPTGKHDVPLELEGTPEFHYCSNNGAAPRVEFKNWRGDWVTYPDVATV